MIRDAEETMEQMKEYWISNNLEAYTKNAMKIQAYKLLLEQHDRGIISCPPQELIHIKQRFRLRYVTNTF